MTYLLHFIFLLVTLSYAVLLSAQDIPPFVVNGSASQTSPVCYQLTPAQMSQAGSIWSEQQINLTQSFEAEVSLYFGCSTPNPCAEDSDSGADGMVFAFQPISTSIGTVGGGMGIESVTPSLCIEFDTYPNGNYNDPTYDHLRIFANGDLDHSSGNSLSPAVPIIDPTTNAEDCNQHTLNVRWDATTQTMSVYMDCALKTSYTGNVVNDIFSGNPNVYWGFTSGTGACINAHAVCINIAPTFQTNDTTICAGKSVQLTAPDNAASYLWTPAIGLNNPNIADPIATPTQTTTYSVAVTNECNFVSNFEVTITVNPSPSAQIDTFLCQGDILIIGNNGYNAAGTFTNSIAMPSGCDSIVTINITMRQPSTAEIFDTICIGGTYILPDLTSVNTAGVYTAIIPNTAGCDSTITVNLAIDNPDCNDNNCNTTDTLDLATCACVHTPITPLDCNDNDCNTTDTYDSTICACVHTPITPLTCDDNDCNTTDTYDSTTCACVHTPITPLDCDDNDCNTTDTYNSATCACVHTPIITNCDDGNSQTIDNYIAATCLCEHIPIEALIIPSAFSPNGDGINETLYPSGENLSSLDFKVYNRWGQLVFEGSNTNAAWDGTFKDTEQEMGVYIYVLTYSTLANPTESKLLQGNVTLVR